MICLDSSFLIDLLRNKESALVKAREIEKEDLFVSSISVFELMFGINVSEDSKQKQRLSKFEALISNLEVIDLDFASASLSSKISAELVSTGKEIESMDCMIAGSMLSNNISKIITANDKHFSRIKGLEIIGY